MWLAPVFEFFLIFCDLKIWRLFTHAPTMVDAAVIYDDNYAFQGDIYVPTFEEDQQHRRDCKRKHEMSETDENARSYGLKLGEANLEFLRAKTKSIELSNINAFADIMSKLNPDWTRDTSLRLKTETWLKKVAFEPTVQLMGAKNPGIVQPPTEFITISEVARDMKKENLTRGQLIKAGVNMAKAYFDRHGRAPTEHVQWGDGCEVMVNSYTEEDRDLMVAAIDSV